MGAKQSKRSVDISGKEAEGAGEVAAAGAGGEGRMEQIADVDALKPQLNGDAHIQTPDEQTDKEKQLDSGTPENEKDATTEKENKDENGIEKEKDNAPVTNGETEQKADNGDSTPVAEEGKKPKKEKVKKKWSLRSISFSRKDKPKQEKKQKEEEAKTNGEPEKVPEEAAEATEAEIKVTEETKPESEPESKDEKTPETPVTEPMTNGSSTPETPKVESPAVNPEPVVPALADKERNENKIEAEPEKLPVNGLTLHDNEKDNSEEVQSKEKEALESTKETVAAPAIEIPVKTEVCVKEMPLIDTTPPPLPANPPPSSVASFAATTMAPELSNASLINTTTAADLTPTPNVCKQNDDEIVTQNAHDVEPVIINTEENLSIIKTDTCETSIPDKLNMDITVSPMQIAKETNIQNIVESQETVNVPKSEMITEDLNETKLGNEEPTSDTPNVTDQVQEVPTDHCADNVLNESPDSLSQDSEILPPPPSEVTDINESGRPDLDDKILETKDKITELNNTYILESIAAGQETFNGNTIDTQLQNVKNISNGVIKDTELIEYNGNLELDNSNTKIDTVENTESINEEKDGNVESNKLTDNSQTSSLSEAPCAASEEADESESFPPPPAELDPDTPPQQDSFPVSDKLADLIPEIPAVPELKTDMDTTSDVAVAN